VWDVPAEGVIAAARTAGRTNLVVTTCDLGENVAIDMARGGFIKGVGAQRPYDQGTTEAMLAGYALLGKTAPVYVAMPAVPVTRSNLLDAWQTVYHKNAPEDVQSSLCSGPGLG
jgi:ribose transport system substrate-binding protein